jgi:hypothetical protein
VALEAEAPLIGELEAIIQAGVSSGELREDVAAEPPALAIAGLTDLALVQHWATDGSKPTLGEIPELVLTLLLGAGSQSAGES